VYILRHADFESLPWQSLVVPDFGLSQLAAVVGLGLPRLVATRGHHKGPRDQCDDPSQARTRHTAKPVHTDRGGPSGVLSLCTPYTGPDVLGVLQPVPIAVA
jgi:hypothetical protein